MELHYSELKNNIRQIKLIGKWDIGGAGRIESQFYGYCAGERPRVLVDLSDVELLATMGIRLLILNAKSVFSRGGRMVLLRPKPEIRNILEVTDVAMIVPIYDGLESAEVVLLAYLCLVVRKSKRHLSQARGVFLFHRSYLYVLLRDGRRTIAHLPIKEHLVVQ